MVFHSNFFCNCSECIKPPHHWIVRLRTEYCNFISFFVQLTHLGLYLLHPFSGNFGPSWLHELNFQQGMFLYLTSWQLYAQFSVASSYSLLNSRGCRSPIAKFIFEVKEPLKVRNRQLRYRNLTGACWVRFQAPGPLLLSSNEPAQRVKIIRFVNRTLRFRFLKIRNQDRNRTGFRLVPVRLGIGCLPVRFSGSNRNRGRIYSQWTSCSLYPFYLHILLVAEKVFLS